MRRRGSRFQLHVCRPGLGSPFRRRRRGPAWPRTELRIVALRPGRRPPLRRRRRRSAPPAQRARARLFCLTLRRPASRAWPRFVSFAADLLLSAPRHGGSRRRTAPEALRLVGFRSMLQSARALMLVSFNFLISAFEAAEEIALKNIFAAFARCTHSSIFSWQAPPSCGARSPSRRDSCNLRRASAVRLGY